MDCTLVLSSKNTSSVSVCKSWQIHMHTFPSQFRLLKSLFSQCFKLQNPSSLLWTSTICVLWFIMSPNHRVIMSSWKSFNALVFVFPCVSLPSFPSQFRTQFMVFWHVFVQVNLRRQLWQSMSFDCKFFMRWDLTGWNYVEQGISMPVFKAWSGDLVSFQRQSIDLLTLNWNFVGCW